MTNLICFSKNRPMQLQALLDSIELHTKGFFNNIDVIYKSEGFDEGYELLKSRKPYVNFVKEGKFDEDVMSLFKYDYTCFAADDDIVFGDFNKGLFDKFEDGFVCFSLRLGLNIDYCYSNDKPNKIKQDYARTEEFMRWEWREEELDFGYPLSVVSHIFRTEDVKKWTEKVMPFKNPNEYEGRLQRVLSEVQPYMVSYQQSKIVGVPANRVNLSAQNRNAEEYGYDTDVLEELYLGGKIIDITKIPPIHSAQQEIEYTFREA